MQRGVGLGDRCASASRWRKKKEKNKEKANDPEVNLPKTRRKTGTASLLVEEKKTRKDRVAPAHKRRTGTSWGKRGGS